MDNIIDFSKPQVAPVEQTYDYVMDTKDGRSITTHGLLSFNPIFCGIVDTDSKLLFAVPMDNLSSVTRVEPTPEYNA